MVDDRLRRHSGVRRRSGSVVFAAAILFLAACGGGDDEASTGPDPGSVSTGAPSQSQAPSAPAGGLQDQTFAIGEHFWHSGFRVDVVEGEILSTENQLSGQVSTVLTLSATLENLGVDTGFFGPALAITTSNNSYSYRFSDEVPDVPGGLMGQATLTFSIDEAFDLASAELLIGDASENQARIPLSGSGDAVRLEPSELSISGMISMELIDLTFTSAELRYDIPDRHREIDNGKVALTLNFDAASRKGGNWQIFATDLVLILPDGTAIAADAVEIGSLPGTDEGVTTTDRNAQFLVGEMPAGDYTLRLTPGSWFIGDDGVTEATFDFTIE